MDGAELLTRVAAELALFAGIGFLIFAANDLAVDIIYFARRMWRSVAVYSRFPRAFASEMASPGEPGFIAILVPAWDEAAVIASMLRATLKRIEHPNYRIFVAHYRNDPATAAAITSVIDGRIEPILVDADGPTTKADCLNYLHDALLAYELATGQSAKAVVLHDAEDLVHPLELTLFDRLIDRAGVIQLPVLPLIDRGSQWISGHYCDEFAEAHAKEMVVREAVGAAIPLAGVGCAIAREPLARIAAMHDGRPFVGCKAHAARHAMDKLATKVSAVKLGIPTAEVRTLDLRDLGCPLAFPVIIKPVHEGSTVGLHVCKSATDWAAALATITRERSTPKGDRCYMVESCISHPTRPKARELTVGLIDNQPLPVIEITPADVLYDYEAKYTRSDTTYTVEPKLPGHITETIQRQTAELAKHIGVRHLARADFMLDGDGPEATAWFLEINTLPGFTDHSLVPMAGRHIGLPMPVLCSKLIELALRDRQGP